MLHARLDTSAARPTSALLILQVKGSHVQVRMSDVGILISARQRTSVYKNTPSKSEKSLMGICNAKVERVSSLVVSELKSSHSALLLAILTLVLLASLVSTSLMTQLSSISLSKIVFVLELVAPLASVLLWRGYWSMKPTLLPISKAINWMLHNLLRTNLNALFMNKRVTHFFRIAKLETACRQWILTGLVFCLQWMNWPQYAPRVKTAQLH